MTTFNFTDRDSYLAWRAEWKANYKQLSEASRKAKADRSSANSTWAKLHHAWHEAESIKLRNIFQQANQDVLRNKALSNIALEQLIEAKAAAAASYKANKEIKMNAQNLDQLIDQMKSCEQAHGLSIYQHGLDVANRYRDLSSFLQLAVKGNYEWSIPEASIIQLHLIAKHALDPKEARTYHVFHDCGKPSCIEIDENGRRHFPDHAKKSTEIYCQLFPEDTRIAKLISKDMLCHTLKGDEAEEFAKDLLAPTLILTAWSELHANAEALFGGFNTDSFKIKRKALTKITAKIYKALSDLN